MGDESAGKDVGVTHIRANDHESADATADVHDDAGTAECVKGSADEEVKNGTVVRVMTISEAGTDTCSRAGPEAGTKAGAETVAKRGAGAGGEVAEAAVTTGTEIRCEEGGSSAVERGAKGGD